jgi:hypothetical protein
MDASIASNRRSPWNKGKLVGQKASLKVKDIWAIRVRLQIHSRQLAAFHRRLTPADVRNGSIAPRNDCFRNGGLHCPSTKYNVQSPSITRGVRSAQSGAPNTQGDGRRAKTAAGLLELCRILREADVRELRDRTRAVLQRSH